MVTLAWLLVTHSWLTAASARGRCGAAAASALLAAYASAVHSRGLVMVADLAVVGTFVGWRRARFRFSVLAAGLTGVVVIAAGWSLNHRLSLALYPEGPRSLAATARTRLTTVLGVIHVLEHAVGGAAARIPEITGFPGVSGCSGVQESGLLSEPAWRR